MGDLNEWGLLAWFRHGPSVHVGYGPGVLHQGVPCGLVSLGPWSRVRCASAFLGPGYLTAEVEYLGIYGNGKV